jgi:3-methyladenine DNA glycosylase AlkD
MVSPSFPASTSREVVDELRRLSNSAELAKLRKRLPAGDEAFGLRMGDLFDVAKRHRQLPLAEVETLLDHPAYEPRLTAFCILDFKARGRLDADRRRELYEVYLRRHDRITSWDMVDRAAPRVVGGYLAGGSLLPLVELAAAADPLRRRTAITAPLYFVSSGSDADVAGAFEIAARLARDPEPVVSNAVGIFAKHGGSRDPKRLRRFLDEHAAAMPRPALRLAIEKLDPDERSHYRSLS